MAFNAALHPRGPNGRFTRSFARHLTTKDHGHLTSAHSGFKPHVPFKGPDDAHGYLSGLSTVKSRPPGQMDRALAQLRAANEALRAGKPETPEIAAMDELMVPLPDGLTVWRRVPASKFGGGKVAPADLKGMLVNDAGFSPTTVAPAKGDPTDVRLRIDVPAGTRAAVSPETSEVVLDRGLPMAVTEVTQRPDGGSDMHLTALPTADATPPTKVAPAKKLTFADLAKATKKAAPAKAAPPPGPAPVKKATPPKAAVPAKVAKKAPSAPPKKAGTTAPAKKASTGGPTRPFNQRLADARRGRDARAAAPRSLMRGSRPPLTAAQRGALEEYRGETYTDINEQLRGGPHSPQVTTMIDRIDAAVAASPLEDDVEGWRGLANAQRLFGSRLGGDLTGMEWREDAYVSTSTDRAVSEDFAGTLPPGAVMMRVLIPRGTGAVELSGEEYESEVMLERGLRMRVVADRGTGPDGVRLIDVEVIRDGE